MRKVTQDKQKDLGGKHRYGAMIEVERGQVARDEVSMKGSAMPRQPIVLGSRICNVIIDNGKKKIRVIPWKK